MAKRISLGLDDEAASPEKIELDDLIKENHEIIKPSLEMQEALEREGEKFGFVSRQSKRRPAKKRSPYIVQSNMKMRVGMKELFQDISEELGLYDQETLELALQSLIEKEGLDKYMSRFNMLVK